MYNKGFKPQKLHVNQYMKTIDRYKERVVGRKRRTNLQTILYKHKIKQYELAQEAEIDNSDISKVCLGKTTDIMLSTAMRICNALNNLLNSDKMTYTIHDIFND